MKRLLLAAVCASILCGGEITVRAESLPPEPEDGRPRFETDKREDLAAKLNLSEEQKAQAERLREEGRKKMEPLMQEKKALREKMDKLRKENMEDFERILTPEQKETFDGMKKHRRPHPGMRPKFGPGKHHRPAPMPRHHDGEMLPPPAVGPEHHPEGLPPLPGDVPETAE